MQNNKTEVVNLFWTGGWDSTFQLLHLLLVEKYEVTPYYLIDPKRKSFGAELDAMYNIKNKIFERYGFSRILLNPTKFYSIEDLKPCGIIDKAVEDMRNSRYYGSVRDQYAPLAKLCKEIDV